MLGKADWHCLAARPDPRVNFAGLAGRYWDDLLAIADRDLLLPKTVGAALERRVQLHPPGADACIYAQAFSLI